MESFPIFFALLLVVVVFAFSMNRGVIGYLSSGVALGSGLLVFGLLLSSLPELARTVLDIDLAWKKSVCISAGIALVAFVIVRVAGGMIFKKLLGRDSWLHGLSDGIGGGIVSLFPSILVVLFLFACIRVGGTVLELNYIASVSRDGIADMGGKIPSYPLAAKWRNSIESVPGIAALLDRVDLFSNRCHRRTAAFALMNQSSLVRAHLLVQPDTADIASDEKIVSLSRDPDVHRAIESQNRVELVLAPRVLEVASDETLAPPLRRVVLAPIVESFVDSIEPIDRR